MSEIDEWLDNSRRIGITGHIRPDGDCLGACTGLYNYLKDICPYADIDIHLESIPARFEYLKGSQYIDTEYVDADAYDLFFMLDSGDIGRIGKAKKYYEQAKRTIVVDHHISNSGYADFNVIVPDASSTCEVLFEHMNYENIGLDVAISLYTGIIHDTGMLKHSNVSEKTLTIAGKLVSKGVPFSKIIDESFYQKTYMQNQLLGRSLLDSVIELGGKCIISVINTEIMEHYGAVSSDLEGIIDQLRVTKGVEVALLLHETDTDEYKVSMRSNNEVDVSSIAISFGGGGHVKAAGCNVKGKINDILKQLTDKIREQL